MAGRTPNSWGDPLGSGALIYNEYKRLQELEKTSRRESKNQPLKAIRGCNPLVDTVPEKSKAVDTQYLQEGP